MKLRRMRKYVFLRSIDELPILKKTILDFRFPGEIEEIVYCNENNKFGKEFRVYILVDEDYQEKIDEDRDFHYGFGIHKIWDRVLVEFRKRAKKEV